MYSDALKGVIPIARSISAGCRLFRQGDETFGIFCLLRGGIKLVRVTPGGAQMPMHIAYPGELFAEASLFSSHYHCDALAVKDSEVLLYPKTAVTFHLNSNAEALWHLTASLARQVQRSRARLELARIRSASDRLVQFLRLNGDASGLCSVEGSLKQLAEEVGLTHEALYRTLARLEREGRLARCEQGLRLLHEL